MTDGRRLGALLLAALVLAALAGLPLALLSAPTPSAQHDAVQRMPPWLRGAHLWAASGALVLVALHFTSMIVAGRTRAAGRWVPLAGLAALAALLSIFFLGTILPWDQQAWEAYTHLRLGLGLAPSNDAASAPLGIVFWAHVLALPALLVAAIVWHARRAAPASSGAKWPSIRRVLALISWPFVVALAVAIVALGILWPPPLGPPPLPGLEISRPHWPFLWLVPLQDGLGPRALILLPLSFLVAALLLTRRKEPARGARLAALVIVALGWAALTLRGAMG